MTPMEVLLGSNRDKKSLQALSQGLRRNKDIAQLAMLSGDETVGNFGRSLYGDVEDKIARRLNEKDKKAQRDLTKGYYDQQAENSRFNQALSIRKQGETERHNRASEGRVLRNALKKVETNTRNLSRDLTKANIPEVQEGISLVNEELKKYEGKGIPGMGGASNILPGMGEDARHIKSLVGRIRNIILKARSGGAVTPQESERLLEEFSLGLFNTDEDFLRAWSDFQDVFSSGVANVYGGYSPEVVDNFMMNMQNQTRSGVQNPSGAPGAPGTDWESLNSSGGGEESPPQSGAVNWNDL